MPFAINSFTYVVFEKEVVQYWNDNLGDINGLRSTLYQDLAKEIFADDLQNVYAEQTAIRNELKTNVAELLESILRNLSADTFANQEIENKLLYLAKRLQNTKGKKIYGYLKSDVKAIIDSIVDLLAQDEAIRQLYDLWYEKKFQILLRLQTVDKPTHRKNAFFLNSV